MFASEAFTVFKVMTLSVVSSSTQVRKNLKKKKKLRKKEET